MINLHTSLIGITYTTPSNPFFDFIGRLLPTFFVETVQRIYGFIVWIGQILFTPAGDFIFTQSGDRHFMVVNSLLYIDYPNDWVCTVDRYLVGVDWFSIPNPLYTICAFLKTVAPAIPMIVVVLIIVVIVWLIKRVVDLL